MVVWQPPLCKRVRPPLCPWGTWRTQHGTTPTIAFCPTWLTSQAAMGHPRSALTAMTMAPMPPSSALSLRTRPGPHPQHVGRAAGRS